MLWLSICYVGIKRTWNRNEIVHLHKIKAAPTCSLWVREPLFAFWVCCRCTACGQKFLVYRTWHPPDTYIMWHIFLLYMLHSLYIIRCHFVEHLNPTQGNESKTCFYLTICIFVLLLHMKVSSLRVWTDHRTKAIFFQGIAQNWKGWVRTLDTNFYYWRFELPWDAWVNSYLCYISSKTGQQWKIVRIMIDLGLERLLSG